MVEYSLQACESEAACARHNPASNLTAALRDWGLNIQYQREAFEVTLANTVLSTGVPVVLHLPYRSRFGFAIFRKLP